MEIVNTHIAEYLSGIIPEREEVLQEMESYAHARHFPIVGPLVGRLLYSLAKTSGARRVFEIGSGFGYSAYWFGKAVPKDGEVICTERDAGNIARAQEYLQRARLKNKVRFLEGDGLKLFDETEGQFDIIFNDADKRSYPKVLRKALPRLRRGGLLISDNVLWSGKILGRAADADTAGILTYNRLIYSSKELFSTIIPLRDGVAVSIKQ